MMTRQTTIPAPMLAQKLPAADRWIDFALVGIVITWGVNLVIVKFGLRQFDPLIFCAMRQLLGVLVVVAVLVARRSWVRLTRRDVVLLMPVAAAFVMGQISFYVGIAATTVTNTALLLATIPCCVALTNRLLRLEHLNPQNWAGIVLALVGSGILFGGDLDLSVSSGHLKGNLWILLSNVGWVAYTVMARPLMRRIPPLVQAAVCMLVGLPVVALIAGPELIANEWSAVTWTGWAAVLFAGIVSFGLGQIIWIRGIQKLGGTRTSAYTNLMPVVGLIAAALFLHERMTVPQMIGGACILLGVVLIRRGHAVVDNVYGRTASTLEK